MAADPIGNGGPETSELAQAVLRALKASGMDASISELGSSSTISCPEGSSSIRNGLFEESEGEPAVPSFNVSFSDLVKPWFRTGLLAALSMTEPQLLQELYYQKLRSPWNPNSFIILEYSSPFPTSLAERSGKLAGRIAGAMDYPRYAEFFQKRMREAGTNDYRVSNPHNLLLIPESSLALKWMVEDSPECKTAVKSLEGKISGILKESDKDFNSFVRKVKGFPSAAR